MCSITTVVKIDGTTQKNIQGYYIYLYNNQINARALIGQSAMVYCASKPMENSRVLS